MLIRIIVAFLILTLSVPIVFKQIQSGSDVELPSFFENSNDVSMETIVSRRKELKQVYQEEIYGQMPNLRPITGELSSQGELDSGYKWIQHSVQIKDLSRQVTATIFLPKTTGPSPALLFLNKCGAHSIISDNDFPEQDSGWKHPYCVEQNPLRGFRADFWSLEEALQRGYAIVTVFENEIAEDDPNLFSQLKKNLPDDLKKETIKTGLLMYWAWGLSHIHQYVSELPEIDANKFGVIGHSRRGKTALLTAAFHEPVSFAVAHQSGTGGAALFRSNRMESISKITTNFPHWLGADFSKYSGHENELPIDQHLLISLIAPRPVLVTEGLWDVWANWDLSWESLRHASVVYEKLGQKGLPNRRYSFYGRNSENLSGRLGQVLEISGHEMQAKYWPPIIQFLKQNGL